MLLRRLYRSICSYCQAVSTHRPLAENQVTKPRRYTAVGSSLKGLLPDYLKGTKCLEFAAKRLYRIAQGRKLSALGRGVGKSALKVATDGNVFKVWRVD